MGAVWSKSTIQPAAAAAIDGPLTTFTLFPKLPPEVRRMIWKRSLPGARYFEFVSMFEPGDIMVSFPRCRDKKIAHMSVNRESRTEALREYVEFRGSCIDCPPTYFSPSLDIICISARTMGEVEECILDAFSQMPFKRLATQDGLEFLGEGPKHVLFRLNLDELILVTGEKERDYDQPGIVGIQDGWKVKDDEFGWLKEYADYCKELEEEEPGWKAPVLRMGTWVHASPSDYQHDNKWIDRAWKAYGLGDDDWNEFFG